ncbi:glycine receptor subunit alphaZ1-like, partial [Convolutriloba macropyga]|uniref:glycine receptor subunit alphaZ1-like n=1 Tax=Convolutriloba macropyga TaxID=536237 RepID=UPI003F51E406
MIWWGMLITVTTVFQPSHTKAINPDEEMFTEFLNNLLDGYDGRIRPNFNGDPVDVELSIHVLSLGSIAETTMDYKATIFLRQIWVDPRLSFSQLNSSVSLTPSFLKKLWVPDAYIINEKEANFHHVTTENKLVRLSPNGEVLYSA